MMKSGTPESQFATKWKVAKACARCHRLKSKCIFEDPTYDSCRRCYALGIKCSVDEDPTADNAKRRNQPRKAAQVAARIEKLLQSVETEMQNFENGLLDMDDTGASKFTVQAARLQVLGTKLAENVNKGNGTKIVEPLPDIETSGELFDETSGLPRVSLTSNLAYELIFTHKFLTYEEAKSRYEYFQRQMLIYYPIISLPKSLEDFDTILQESALLLVTCIYVTTVTDHGLSGDGGGAANRKLNQVLRYYVNRVLASHIYVEASSFSYHTVLACLILSLWCVPPDKVGQFKSQVDLMSSFCLSLCIDVGNVTMYEREAILDDDSTERNNLRSFLGLYCCCGSLGFSLPRFKLVAWSKRHELTIKRLLESSGKNIPTRNDRFLCYYARIIRVGQELFDYFAVNGVSMHFLSSEEKSSGLGGLPISRLEESGTLPLANITLVLKNYESTLRAILYESGFINEDSLTPKEEAPKEKYALLLTYYQLMMMTHDNLVSWCICRLTAEKNKLPTSKDSEDSLLIAQHIIKFGEICEKILQCFININEEPTINYPTFFFYRALHALISLIRLSVLVKSEILSSRLMSLNQVRFNLQSYFEQISAAVETNKTLYDLTICHRISQILQRISKWVHVVANYDKLLNLSDAVNIDFIKLTDMSKGQEIEKLKDPLQRRSSLKRQKLDDAVVPEITKVQHTETRDTEEKEFFRDVLRFAADPTESRYTPNYSIQEIFKEIDQDILRYLNPFDTTDADGPSSNFFNEYLSKDF